MIDDNGDFDYTTAVQIEHVYTPSDRFLDVFYSFASRLESLQRYHKFISRYLDFYLAGLEASWLLTNIAQSEYCKWVTHQEIKLGDHEYFGPMLRGSILAHVFSLLETLLHEVTKDICEQLRVELAFPEKGMPYIDKYLWVLKNRCGVIISIDKQDRRKIAALMELRNRYIHSLNREIPADILQVLGKSADGKGSKIDISANHINDGFALAGRLAHKLDSAYWEFYEAHELTASQQ